MSTPQKHIPATEVKNNFGRCMNLALKEPLVITSRRRPKVVLISYESYHQAIQSKQSVLRLRFGELMQGLAQHSDSATLSDDYKQVLYGDPTS